MDTDWSLIPTPEEKRNFELVMIKCGMRIEHRNGQRFYNFKNFDCQAFDAVPADQLFAEK